MARPLGSSFAPVSANDEETRKLPPAQQAIQVLSMRFPRVRGAKTISPLLGEPGSAARRQVGGFSPESAVLQTLMQAMGTGAEPSLPSGSQPGAASPSQGASSPFAAAMSALGGGMAAAPPAPAPFSAPVTAPASPAPSPMPSLPGLPEPEPSRPAPSPAPNLPPISTSKPAPTFIVPQDVQERRGPMRGPQGYGDSYIPPPGDIGPYASGGVPPSSAPSEPVAPPIDAMPPIQLPPTRDFQPGPAGPEAFGGDDLTSILSQILSGMTRRGRF